MASRAPSGRANDERAIGSDHFDAGFVGGSLQVESFAEFGPHDAFERQHEALQLAVQPLERETLLHDGDGHRAH